MRLSDSITPTSGIDRHRVYTYGLRYIDDIMITRENADFTNDSGGSAITYDETWYHLTDVQFSTMALLTNGGKIEERVVYDAYGDAMHHYANDVDGDGDYDNSDYTTISTLRLGPGGTPITSANYTAACKRGLSRASQRKL